MGFLSIPRFSSFVKVVSGQCWRSCCTLPDGRGNNNSKNTHISRTNYLPGTWNTSCETIHFGCNRTYGGVHFCFTHRTAGVTKKYVHEAELRKKVAYAKRDFGYSGIACCEKYRWLTLDTPVPANWVLQYCKLCGWVVSEENEWVCAGQVTGEKKQL